MDLIYLPKVIVNIIRQYTKTNDETLYLRYLRNLHKKEQGDFKTRKIERSFVQDKKSCPECYCKGTFYKGMRICEDCYLEKYNTARREGTYPCENDYCSLRYLRRFIKYSKLRMPVDVGTVKFPKHIIDEARKIGIDYELFQTVGKESNYCCLMPWQIEKVNEVICENVDIKSTMVVIDGTAHIGCNVVNLAKVFPDSKIHAIELNSDVYNVLTENIARLDPSISKRFVLHNGDCQSIIPSLIKDDLSPKFIYLDPYWDIESEQINLYLGDTNVVDFIPMLINKTNTVCLRAPYNFNIDKLYKLYNIKVFEIYKTSSMIIDYYLIFVSHNV